MYCKTIVLDGTGGVGCRLRFIYTELSTIRMYAFLYMDIYNM